MSSSFKNKKAVGLTTTFLKDCTKQNAKCADDLYDNCNPEDYESGKGIKQAGEAAIAEGVNGYAGGNKEQKDYDCSFDVLFFVFCFNQGISGINRHEHTESAAEKSYPIRPIYLRV